VEIEVLSERAAIMEYDAKMDRKTATLSTFALYYPDEYKAMQKRMSETLIYEWVEKMLKEHVEKLKPLQKRDGITALTYITGKGIALIGAYDNGAYIAKLDTIPTPFTTDINEIKSLMNGKGNKYGEAKGTNIKSFRFIPKNTGFLCIDIDRKNGKDGIKEFYTWAERTGKPRNLLPSYLQNIPDSFPCYVQTPSNGYHLYFKFTGQKQKKKPISPEAPAVEIFHDFPLVSAGSFKDGKPYILHGELENAPTISAFILEAIEPPKQKAAAYTPHTPTKKQWGKPSWELIVEWTEKDGIGSGRNDLAFNLARHARNHGYTETETITAIKGEPSINGLPEKEIETAVRSAFSKRKTA